MGCRIARAEGDDAPFDPSSRRGRLSATSTGRRQEHRQSAFESRDVEGSVPTGSRSPSPPPAGRQAAYLASEDVVSQSDTEGRRTPNPLDPPRDATPSLPGSVRSELDISTVEVDIGEKTPPLTLVAIVTAFAHDLAVQRQALRYLALVAYEHQLELGRDDVAAQLVRTLQRALDGFRDGQDCEHRTIDIAALSQSEACASPARSDPARRRQRAPSPEGTPTLPTLPPAPPQPPVLSPSQPAALLRSVSPTPDVGAPQLPPPPPQPPPGRAAVPSLLARAVEEPSWRTAATPTSSAPASCSSWALASTGHQKGAQEMRIDVTCYVLQVLSGVAQHHAANQVLLTECGVFPAVFEAMELHQYTIEVLTHGMRLLSTLTVLPEGRKEFIHRNGMEVLLALVETNSCDAQLQQSGCRMLAHLLVAQDHNMVADIDWARIASCLRQARVSHPQHATIASLAMQAHAATLHAYRHALTKGVRPRAGDVAALCLTLQIAPGNAGLHNNMLTLLLDIVTQRGGADSHLVMSEGGADACVSTLMHDSVTVASCVTAARCLGELAMAETSHGELLIQKGATEAVLTALRFFPQSLVLSEHALRALSRLILSQGGREAFAEEGGVAAALDAMRTHLSVVHVQHLGAECLLELCRGDERARTRVVEADGAAVLAGSLRMHPCPGPALQLLTVLAQSPKHRSKLSALVPTFIQVLSQSLELVSHRSASPADQQLHQSLLRLMSMQCVDASSRDLVADHGGVRVLISVMWFWRDDASAATAGAPALRDLAQHSGAARQLRHHTGMNLLEHMVKRHPAASTDADAALSVLAGPT